MNLLVLSRIGVLPLFDLFWRKLLTIPTVNRVLRNRAFQLFKLVLYLLALRLFLIKLGLKLAGHAVVAVLGVFKVKANLMDISECIEVLVVTHHLV